MSAEVDVQGLIGALDPEKVRADVKHAVRRFTRAGRITTAREKPVRRRTAEQAALCALGRLIQDGTFK